MASEVRMPQMSDTMHSGKILEWQKKEGDPVARGDILAVVETDKANLEIESFSQGTLLRIAAPAGTTVNVGSVIAYVGEAGEAVGAAAVGSKPQAVITENQAAAAQHTIETSAPTVPTASTHLSNGTADHSESAGRIIASPLARKIAHERNVNLEAVHGSGPNGRIVRSDVEAAISSTSAASPPKPTPVRELRPSPTPPSTPTTTPSGMAGTFTEFSKMRETIARRMQESVTQYPHFYVTSVVEMSEAAKLREALKEEEQYKGISFNHLVIKAAAYALSKEPRVNRAARDGKIFQPSQINIGIITAIEDGLLIPVIREADKLSLKDIVFESRAAVERARAGRPNSTDLSGGTFSISNLGMFDVDSFTAIINPGQGGVLAVSSVKDAPVISNGQVVAGRTMKVTLSVDHRVIDGVMGATFLQHFKRALEIPALLMM